MNITDPIRYVARISPAAAAVIRRDDVVVSFRQFDRLIDATAAILGEFGIAAGQVVGLGISGPDTFPGLVVALGLARLGAASADMAMPAARMDLCIHEPGSPPKPGVRSVANAAIWARAQQAAAAAMPFPTHPGGAALCRVFATSGSTGTPKFVAIGHDLMAARVLSGGLALGGERAVRICGLGLGIGVSLVLVLRTLWTGGTLVLTDTANAAAAIRRHGVTSLLVSAFLLQELLIRLEPGAPPPTLRSIDVSGSGLPAPMYARVQQLLCRNVMARFGATETGAVASAPMAALHGDPLAVGIVHPGVQVEAVDTEGRTLPPDREGELRIRSASLASGYLDDPETSAAAFRDGWFYSGDLGSVSADGVMRVSGRIGEVINSGGVKVSPRVIEDVLLASPNVTDAAAFGVPDDMGVVRIWAAVVPTEPLPEPRLQALCSRLGESAPRSFLQLQSLPRTANGKLVREELVKAALARQAQAAPALLH